jgi:hypothetical protein
MTQMKKSKSVSKGFLKGHSLSVLLITVIAPRSGGFKWGFQKTLTSCTSKKKRKIAQVFAKFKKANRAKFRLNIEEAVGFIIGP